MAAAEGSFVGMAIQHKVGEPNRTDADFKYLLFRQGQASPNNIVIPLDNEVGGGALARSMVKVGVNFGGSFDLVPRPETLGHFFYGALGKVATQALGGGAYNHTFTLDPADNFSAPYYTVRSAPGNLWGEEYEDVRMSLLALNWRGANFVDGMVTMLGRNPKKVATTSWGALARVDSGPQFLAPLGAIELPTGTSAHVLSGSFVANSAIPLDEQYVVGAYSPEGLDIVSRSFALQLIVKISDSTLYTKMAYDPAGGNAWAASIFKEANIRLEFSSDREAVAGIPYKFSISANGSTGDNANVLWTAAPLSVRAQRQLVMMVTAQFLASPTSVAPITVNLINQKSAYVTSAATSSSVSPSASPSGSASPSASVSPSASPSA